MTGNRTYVEGQEGTYYCRPTNWLDVCKFFLFNYALHAFTIINAPGSGIVTSLFHSVLSILLPFPGVFFALFIICENTRRPRNDFESALRATALCMVVPKREEFRCGDPISPAMTDVHGSHPAPSSSSSSQTTAENAEETPHAYELVLVPGFFTIKPLIPEGTTTAKSSDTPRYKTKLGSNSNILKSGVAILQICYGSYELYDAYKGKLEKLGYASYALTVIPYIMMSFLNLCASLCQPGYSAMYLVHYRGEMDYEPPRRCKKQSKVFSANSEPKGSGYYSELEDVEEASTDREHGKERDQWMVDAESKTAGAVGLAYSLTKKGIRSHADYHQTQSIIKLSLIGIALALCYILPYLLIFALTGFRGGQSTIVERIFTIGPLLFGQFVFRFKKPNVRAFSRRGRKLYERPMIKYNIPWPISSMCGKTGSLAFFNPLRSPSAADMEYIRNSGWFSVSVFVFTTLWQIAPALGGFVVVAQMILKDQICVKL